ncbi:hypothetical protein ACIXCY_22895, partial [Bacteroides fragilis]
AFCKPAVINNKFHVDVILMVAAKFAYSFQGVKDILVLTELGKHLGRGVKAKRIKNSRNHLINYD